MADLTATITNKVAKGFIKGNYRKVQIGFDEDVYLELRTRAIKDGTSFAEQVRVLVEWGLESAQETKA